MLSTSNWTAQLKPKRVYGRPFGKDNPPPGRPKGLRNRATMAVQEFLDGESQAITRKCVEMALDGDQVALKLCMDRLCPPLKESPIEFNMPPLCSVHDVTSVMSAIMQATAEGKILLSQAVEFGKLLELYARTQATASTPWPVNLTDDELKAEILQLQARVGSEDTIVESESST